MTGVLRKSTIAIVIVALACVVAFSIKGSVIRRTGSVLTTNSAGSTIVNPVNKIAGYKAWTKVNSVPQLMPERVAAACALWISSTGVVVDGSTNPHRNKYLTVYVNELGRKAMLSKKEPNFPVGSVIVKEKLAAPDSQVPELLTVMIKQKAGFNAAAGDWEYMVVDGTGTKLAGRGNLANCESCHVARQKTDYVFRTYLPEGAEAKLK